MDRSYRGNRVIACILIIIIMGCFSCIVWHRYTSPSEKDISAPATNMSAISKNDDHINIRLLKADSSSADTYIRAYLVKVDNVSYLVVDRSNGIAIIRHDLASSQPSKEVEKSN